MAAPNTKMRPITVQIVDTIGGNALGTAADPVVTSITYPLSVSESVRVEATASSATIGNVGLIDTSSGVQADIIPVNGYNGLVTIAPGHVSTVNSTSDVLDPDVTWVGGWEDVTSFGVIVLTVHASHGSVTDGLEVEFSSDGVNIDSVDNFTILANSGKTFSFQASAQYLRIKFTNVGTLQTHFRLQTVLKPYYVKPSSHRISDVISGEDDAELVKSIITGAREDLDYGSCVLDNENNLRVNSFPYTYSIAEGAILGHTALLKFGTRTSVAAATSSTVWEGPTAIYAYMSTAQQLKITSTDNVNDNVGGTGALTLTVIGLDANWAELEETVTMTGTTAVTTNASFIRVFRAYVATCGTSLTNTGTISVKNNASTVTQAIIGIGDAQTLMSIWSVPAGKTAYIVQGTASTDSNKGARVSFFVKLNDGGTLYPWRIQYRAFLFSGTENYPFTIPFVVPAKTDIEVRVTTPGSAGTTSFGSTFELWYE